VSLARCLPRYALAATVGFALLSAVGCSLGSGTLGGRERCWPEGDPRAASLWRGTLRIDATSGRLETPEGEVIPLKPGALATRVGNRGLGELVRGGEVVARSGDDVTLFGGAGSDGALLVCAVEEIHSAS
jgi:hypothetical protein